MRNACSFHLCDRYCQLKRQLISKIIPSSVSVPKSKVTSTNADDNIIDKSNSDGRNTSKKKDKSSKSNKKKRDHSDSNNNDCGSTTNTTKEEKKKKKKSKTRE